MYISSVFFGSFFALFFINILLFTDKKKMLVEGALHKGRLIAILPWFKAVVLAIDLEGPEIHRS